jgi:hypothetical protein
MRIRIAGNDPSTKHDHIMADAVGRAIEKELTERLPDVHVRELAFGEWPLAHRLTLQYAGKIHTYYLPSQDSLQTAPVFCEAIVEKLTQGSTPTMTLTKRFRALRHRLFDDA